jgi:hypothetical protein
MTREDFKDPAFLSKNTEQLKFVIAKSSGKGNNPIDEALALKQQTTDSGTTEYKDTEGKTEYSVTDAQKKEEVRQLIETFNKESPGRFDYYLENVEFDMNWSITNGSQSPKIRFDVHEPYGIGGFIESLRVNAIAAGFEDHRSAPFLFRIDFIGWKKGDKLQKSPEIIPNATRTFPIILNQMSLETTERGSMYKCAASPHSALGLGPDTQLASTAKMEGTTVGDVIDSLMKQVEESRKKDNNNDEEKNFNSYKIKYFDNDGKEIDSKTSDIAKSVINPMLQANQVYSFPTPDVQDEKSSVKIADAGGETKTIPYNGGKEVVQFASGSAMTDVITAVIRDSEYTKGVLEKLQNSTDPATTFPDGLVPWYRVTVSTEEIKPGVNQKSQDLNYIFTFKVRPYKIHYTKIPGFASGVFDGKTITDKYVRRKYDYLYTGNNVDILGLQLKFNNLFYQQRPYQFGKRDAGTKGGTALPSGEVELKGTDQVVNGTAKGQPTAPVKTDPNFANLQIAGGQGGPRQNNPYYNLALAMHETMMDGMDLNQADMTIIGDPFYLVTASVNNVDVEVDPEAPSQMANGEAPWTSGQVYINLNFKTPIDIQTSGTTKGLAEFQAGHLPFSGIYYITNIHNSFRDGTFQQKLHIIRLPGQLIGARNLIPVLRPKTIPKMGETLQADTKPDSVNASGTRASDASLLNMLSRGLPSFGLPGVLANFNNIVGGALGGLNAGLNAAGQAVNGAVASVFQPLNGLIAQNGAFLNSALQVGGLVAAGAALVNGFNNSGSVGQSVGGYNPYTSGIRMNTAGLTAITTNNSTNASIDAQANLISSIINDPTYVNTLNEDYFNNGIYDANNIAVASPSQLSNADQETAVVLNSTPADPSAIAAQLGLDPKALSGLSGNQLSSVLSQLQTIASKVPDNTNIAGLAAAGLSMANIYGASIPNLPALQPPDVAKLAAVSASDTQKIIAAGGNIANLPGALAVPGVAFLLSLLTKNNTNNGIQGGAGSLNNQSTTDKLNTAQGLSSSLLTSNATPNTAPSAVTGYGSVESNTANTVKTVAGYTGYFSGNTTAYSQFGTQRQTTPIDKLMQTKGVTNG